MRGAAFVLVAWATAPARAEPLHLADVLRRVAEESPDQAVARAQVPVARAEARTAGMWPNPGLVVSGARIEPVFSAAVQVRLPVLGQRGARVHAAEAFVEQTRAEASATLWRLRHDARIAYYAAVRSEEEATIAVDVEALTQRVAAMAAERFEVGAGTRLEQEQAALLHVRARQDVSDRRAVAVTSRLELARLLGVGEPLGALADGLAVVGAVPPRDELAAQARTTHPELRALALEREAALRRAGAGRADRRPVPTAELGVDLLDASTCGGTKRCVAPRGSLAFDLPIFNLNGGPIERAEAEARLVEARAHAAAIRVETAVGAAYAAFTAAGIRARFFDTEYQPAALRVEQMAREGFTTGKTGLLPLIEAERAVLEARLARAGALYSVQVARADLEEASGVPLSAP